MLSSISKDFWKFYAKYNTVIKVLVFALYYIIGSAVFCSYEKWSILESVYFITVGSSTVGYGFYHPTVDGSKLFSIFYLTFGVTIILNLVNEFTQQVLLSAQDELIIRYHRFRGFVDITTEDIRKYRMILCVLAALLCVLIGSLFYSGNEDWSAVDSVYWTAMTMLTVGLGDLEIKYNSTRVFTIFFILSSVLIFAITYNNLLEAWVDSVVKKRDEAAAATRGVLHRQGDALVVPFDSSWVQKTIGKDGMGCSKERFILSVLLEKNKLSYRRDVAPLIKAFTTLDVGERGVLTLEALERFARLESDSDGTKGTDNPLLTMEQMVEAQRSSEGNASAKFSYKHDAHSGSEVDSVNGAATTIDFGTGSGRREYIAANTADHFATLSSASSVVENPLHPLV